MIRPLRAVLALVLLATACEGSPGKGRTPGDAIAKLGCLAEGRPLAMAIGSRANSPAPAVGGFTGLVTRTSTARQKVTLIRVDGAPAVVFSRPFQPTGENDSARQDELRLFMKHIATILGGDVRAKKPQADPLRALSLAAREAGPGGNVVLLDSGIQTVAPLDFGRKGMLGADPDEVAGYLDRAGLLPDLTGRHVLLSGIGDAALPQEGPDDQLRNRLVTIWTKIVQRAHAACVAVDDRPNTAAAVNDVPAVRQVALPRPKTVFAACGTTKLGEEDHVGFRQGTADLREPGKARTVLRALAGTVRNGEQKIDLTGTTSSEGGDKVNGPLSKKRAGAVRDILVDLGVKGSRITIHGLGTKFPGFVPDMAPDGKTLLPDKAPLNRKVVVKLTCS